MRNTWLVLFAFLAASPATGSDERYPVIPALKTPSSAVGPTIT
jgi:hypothetical protein